MRGVISPLEKRAGGKRQLVHALNNRLPDNGNNFYEPFPAAEFSIMENGDVKP